VRGDRRVRRAVAVSPPALRLLEHLHGHIGVLAAAALIHPALMLRRRRRSGAVVVVASAATALVTMVGALGGLLYPGYRQLVKPALFARWPAVGWAFERKEHLGVATILLAWAGLAALLAEPRPDAGGSVPPVRAARVAYVAAAISATITATLGVWAAAHATF
jgi:hypothetical protein